MHELAAPTAEMGVLPGVLGSHALEPDEPRDLRVVRQVVAGGRMGNARGRLLDMARAARRAAIPDAANRVARSCLEVARA